MKTTVLILLATVSLAHANLIDLTPGGFDLTQPVPTVVQQFYGRYGGGMRNVAGANIVNGLPVWSPFTIFGDDHFDITLNGTGGAEVGWDLTGTGFRGMFVLIENSELIGNLYAIPGRQMFSGTGFVDDGPARIDGITFTGTNSPVPDSGSTLVLMVSGLLGLFVYARRVNASASDVSRSSATSQS